MRAVILMLLATVAAAEPVQRFATVRRQFDLVQGDRRLALWTAGQWMTFAANGLVRDGELAAELKRQGERIPSNVYWGRTPLVAADRQLLRPRDRDITTLPGELESMVGHGELELWRYQDKGVTWAATMDARGKLQPLAPVEGGGDPSYAKRLPALCDRARPWRITWAPTGVAALFLTCDPYAEATLVTLALDGKRSTRRLRAHLPELEGEAFAILPDGTPLLVGRRSGRFALGRAGADGSWAIQSSQDKIVAIWQIAVDARGDVWTITLGQGPDGKDLYKLYRNLEFVPLSAPDGRVLAPGKLGFDQQAGIVVDGYIRDGTMESLAVKWLFAQNPPKGSPLDLP